ncbi:cysteine protease ATG4D-like [Pezoporus wallicus]|uniref:cysteine protease ATG4D-like n=1 Tax=Pezoporus wallicus TaxID=35540 RepID=UPI00254CAF87|nr:cysteine protease ATG4D-like [Pezoporus wallicus]
MAAGGGAAGPGDRPRPPPRPPPRAAGASAGGGGAAAGAASGCSGNPPPLPPGARMRGRVLSAWNSLKYGFPVRPRSHVTRGSPLHVLGREYSPAREAERRGLARDVLSRPFLSYRRGFPALRGSAWSSDGGWGCTLRSAQMLLAHGLLLHRLGRDWTWPEPDPEPPPPGAAPSPLRSLLRCFGDHPRAPLGLHRLVALGSGCGRAAGDWFGPAAAAHILRRAVETWPDSGGLSVYVAQDCTVYRADVAALLRGGGTGAVIILVPVRLGGDALNPIYVEGIKELFKLESCLGIIGGKPRHSLYFIGFQDDFLLYLDPHYCQPYVDTEQENFPLESFQCRSLRRMPFGKMDPSCTIGFYAGARTGLDALCRDLTRVLAPPTAPERYPLFTLVEGGAQGMEPPSPSETPPPTTTPPGAEEFVFL